MEEAHPHVRSLVDEKKSQNRHVHGQTLLFHIRPPLFHNPSLRVRSLHDQTHPSGWGEVRLSGHDWLTLVTAPQIRLAAEVERRSLGEAHQNDQGARHEGGSERIGLHGLACYVRTWKRRNSMGRPGVTSVMSRCIRARVRLEVDDFDCRCDIRQGPKAADAIMEARRFDDNLDEVRKLDGYGQQRCEGATAAWAVFFHALEETEGAELAILAGVTRKIEVAEAQVIEAETQPG